jgi:hypothetical protein
MKLILIIAKLAFVLMVACKSIEAQYKCLTQYINGVKELPEFSIIRSAANDSVGSWIAKKL